MKSFLQYLDEDNCISDDEVLLQVEDAHSFGSGMNRHTITQNLIKPMVRKITKKGSKMGNWARNRDTHAVGAAVAERQRRNASRKTKPEDRRGKGFYRGEWKRSPYRLHTT